MMQKPRGQLTSVREICDHYGTPFDPVAHVLRILNSEGLVQSEQGAHGGYRLQDVAAGTHLARFIEIIEGPMAFTQCMREEDCRCTMMDRCNIISPMQTLNGRMQDFLKSITLQDLLNEVPLGAALEAKKLTATA
jgi:Rrf2 family protein